MLLAHQIVRGSTEPVELCFVLHGVFGMGTNFRTIAQRLAERSPRWGFVLVDLRAHGASQGLPPPHDLASAARDLFALSESLPLPVRAIVGHSFGGKVALQSLAERPSWADAAFVLDSDPSASPPLGDATSVVVRVLEALEELDGPIAKREDFAARLREKGFAEAIVQWLAMNVRRNGDAYELRLDLPAIRSMLMDYRARDLWSVFTESERTAFHVVLAGEGSAVGEGARAELARVSANSSRVQVHELPRAGHWVHVDAPEEIIAIVSGGLNVLSESARVI